MCLGWITWNRLGLTNGFEPARRATESVQRVIIDEIHTLLTKDKAVA
jgi:Lhr-like helicase